MLGSLALLENRARMKVRWRLSPCVLLMTFNQSGCWETKVNIEKDEEILWKELRLERNKKIGYLIGSIFPPATYLLCQYQIVMSSSGCIIILIRIVLIIIVHLITCNPKKNNKGNITRMQKEIACGETRYLLKMVLTIGLFEEEGHN